MAARLWQGRIDSFNASQNPANTNPLIDVVAGDAVLALVTLFESGSNPAAATVLLDGLTPSDESAISANLHDATFNGGTRMELHIWRAVAAGDHFVSVAPGVQVKTIYTAEYTGLLSTGDPVLAASVFALASASGSAPSVSAVGTADDNIWFGGFCGAVIDGHATVASPFALLAQQVNGGSFLCGAAAYSDAGASAETITFDLTAGSAWWIAGLFGLKADPPPPFPPNPDSPWVRAGDLPFKSIQPHLLVAPNGKAYLIGGGVYGESDNNDAVLRSDDRGASWSQVGTFPIKMALGAAFALASGRLVVAGGSVSGIAVAPNDVSNAVYASDDEGVSWNQIGTLPERVALQAFAQSGGSLFMMGGQIRSSVDPFPYGPSRKVFRSNDGGANWFEVGTDVLPFSQRIDGLGVALGSALLLIGGVQEDAPTYAMSDVFRSVDGGASWTKIGDLIQPTETGLMGLGFRGGAWLVGGIDGDFVPLDAVAISATGASWEADAALVLPYKIGYGAVAALDADTLLYVGGNNIRGDFLDTTYTLSLPPVPPTPPQPDGNLTAGMTVPPRRKRFTGSGQAQHPRMEASGSGHIVAAPKARRLPAVLGAGSALLEREASGRGRVIPRPFEKYAVEPEPVPTSPSPASAAPVPPRKRNDDDDIVVILMELGK
jgi:hypothetical protein